MKINLWTSRIFSFLFTHSDAPLGETTLVEGDMVMVVCKQGLVFTVAGRLQCPFVDAEPLWETFSFPGYFLPRHVYFIFWYSFDNSPGYQIAALFSVGCMFNLSVFCLHSKFRNWSPALGSSLCYSAALDRLLLLLLLLFSQVNSIEQFCYFCGHEF